MNNHKLDLILTKLGSIENEQREMKQVQTDMLKRLDNLETNTDAIREQVVRNSEDISEMKGTQKDIVKIIKRQEDTINILARRSIDQEAEIKRIK